MKNIFISIVVLSIFVVVTFVSCRKKNCDGCRGNKPPMAVAGPDQIITLPTDTAMLNGSASNDADGKITEAKWTKIAGPASFSLVNDASLKAVIKNLVAGVYEFELMVKDNGGLSAKDTLAVTVNVLPNNQPPVAKAGADQTITLPVNSVTIDGSGSTDPDNNIMSYAWTKISGPLSFSITNATEVKTQVNNFAEGVYQFELKITDAGGLSSKDTVLINVKPDLSLAIQWKKAIGGSRVDVGQAIQPTTDGGYILVGNTNSQDGDIIGYHSGAYGCYLPCIGPTICGYFPDGLVVKLSSTGAIQWQKALGGSAAENLLSIQSTPDGGFITSGLTYSNDGDVSGYHGGTEADAWVVKLSSTGDVQWQKVLGGSTGCDFANSILSTTDGGYIFVGHTDSHDGDVNSHTGERDVWIVKLNSSGTIQWQKTMGGAANDYAFSLQPTSDGGYITAGYTYSNDGDVSGNHGDADVWIVKLNNSGIIQWQKALGGSKEEVARSIQPTPDGGYIIGASSKSNDGDVSGNHGDADAWIVKLSSTGAIQWQKSLGGSNEEIGRSVQPATDGGYIIAGSAKSSDADVSVNNGGQDVWIVKLSNTGVFQWQKSLGGTSNDFANSIHPTSDGGYIVAGQAISNNGDVSGNKGTTDAWVIKLKLP